jgi:hypothetical protein
VPSEVPPTHAASPVKHAVKSAATRVGAEAHATRRASKAKRASDMMVVYQTECAKGWSASQSVPACLDSRHELLQLRASTPDAGFAAQDLSLGPGSSCCRVRMTLNRVAGSLSRAECSHCETCHTHDGTAAEEKERVIVPS